MTSKLDITPGQQTLLMQLLQQFLISAFGRSARG